MITYLRVKNFKCFEDVEITFGPLTVLIGENDSGKSTLFDALWTLGRTTTGAWSNAFPDTGGMGDVVWQKDASRAIEWQVRGDAGGKSFEYALALTPWEMSPLSESLSVNGQGLFSLHRQPNSQPPVAVQFVGTSNAAPLSAGLTVLAAYRQNQPLTSAWPVYEMLTSVERYRLDPAELRKDAQLQRRAVLSARGENIVAALDALANEGDHSAFLELKKAFHEAVPTLRGFSMPSTGQGGTKSLEVQLEVAGKKAPSVPARLTSDGALRLLAYLALAYGPGHGTIFIEEPENGLHYSRLVTAIELLRKISTGELGDRPRQVIITTHSPVLLNLLEPEVVRLFTRPGGGGTKITPLESIPNIATLRKEFATGELWYLLGEEALTKESTP